MAGFGAQWGCGCQDIAEGLWPYATGFSLMEAGQGSDGIVEPAEALCPLWVENGHTQS